MSKKCLFTDTSSVANPADAVSHNKVRQRVLQGEVLLVVVPVLAFGEVPRAGFMHAVIAAKV